MSDNSLHQWLFEGSDCLTEADAIFDPTEKKHLDSMHESNQRSRPCAWIRNNEYRKRLRRRYQIMHPTGNDQHTEGIRLRSAIYDSFDSIDWRTNGSVNYHQHLYLSCRGDIRVYHGAITAYPGVFAPVPASVRKKETSLANRRIRHMKNLETSCINYSSLKKQYTHLDDGL